MVATGDVKTAGRDSGRAVLAEIVQGSCDRINAAFGESKDALDPSVKVARFRDGIDELKRLKALIGESDGLLSLRKAQSTLR